MNTRIYLRASTKDQDAERALQILQDLNQNLNWVKPLCTQKTIVVRS